MPSRDDEERRPPDGPPSGADPKTAPHGGAGSAETTELNRPEASTGSLTERFELVAELGRGGMGIVHKARDRETGETVALKVLKPGIAARQDLIERFKSELRLARKITHKNVCRVYDLHRFGETVAIAMEYVEGESLRAVLNRPGGVSLRGGLNWASEISSALAEAHSQGVVHRDLKPENILIARQGHAKVMDFGIARSLEGEATQAGGIIGTPAYMSPEQAEGKPADARSDIYSLGLILYEMFTGRAAFTADTPVALAVKQIHETPPPPREAEPDLPARIDRAIERCLQKNPKKRFQTVAELRAALTERGEARPAAVAAAGKEAELPVVLTRWQRGDWLLVVAAVAGLTLFFPFFNRTSLAPRSKISFDRSVLRKIARDFAQRLGAPVVGEGRIGSGGDPEAYVLVAERAGAQAALELCNNPVPYWTWEVAWDNGTVVMVDNHGSLEGFLRNFPEGASPERLPLEEARPLAEKALRDYFGLDPSVLVLESAASDAWVGHPADSFTWADRNDYEGLKRRYRVRLVGREIANLDRGYEFPAGFVERDILPVWQLLPWLTLVLILVGLGFAQRHLVEVGARWRVATAGLVAVAGMWMVWYLPPLPPVLKIFFLPTLGFASGVMTMFGSIPVELSVRRMAPAKLVSLARSLTRAAASAPCGLAILRGTFLGFALLGTDTFLVWLGTSHSNMFLDSFLQILAEPRLYLSSALLSAHVLGAVDQVFIVTLLVTLFTSLMARLVRRSWLAIAVAATLSVLVVSAPFLSMGAVQPYHWKMVLLFLDFLVLAWTFTRFDVLTLAWAVFTFAFCWENHQLLIMLTPAGVFEPWIDFAVFGLFVAAAGAVAFQASLRTAYRRVAAGLE